MLIKNSKRLVIKVGSALTAPGNNGCSSKHLTNIANFIQNCRRQDTQVILVSSGSVAAGRQWFTSKEPSKALKKAMAAAGQTDMMAVWGELLDMPLAQMLLTHADLCDRERYVSIKETIESLLDHGLLPIVNENDVVTSDELKVGDNDNLAAMTAAAVDADTLVMCTDVDGFYDKNPQSYSDAKLLQRVLEITPSIYSMATGSVSSTGTGGMLTKIEAAEKAMAYGIHTYIVNGFDSLSLELLSNGGNPGTHFLPSENPLSPAIHWMTHTVRECGEVIIEDGKSDFFGSGQMLTSEKMLEVNGQFSVGDSILVSSRDGKKVVKAKANYSSCLLNHIVQQQDVDNIEEQTPPQKYSLVSKEHLAVLES